jgi:hypothetical protein
MKIQLLKEDKIQNEIPQSYLSLGAEKITQDIDILKSKAALFNSSVIDLNNEV